MTKIALIVPALLAACQTLPPDGYSHGPGETGTCNANWAQPLVGRSASTEVGVEAVRLSGARGIRWIRPGDAVTMDYRPDRLNIELDANNRVAAIRCG